VRHDHHVLGGRTFGKSTNYRDHLPQVVIAMAVTRDDIPVRCWTFLGNTQDQKIIRSVKDDLGNWNLRRMVWVADWGFASAANRAYRQRGGGHYIHAEKLRHTNTEATAALARPGRYRSVEGNLRGKEVRHPARPDRSDGRKVSGSNEPSFAAEHNPGKSAIAEKTTPAGRGMLNFDHADRARRPPRTCASGMRGPSVCPSHKT
jgi:hypothetical protein